jgi:hypothetical protein
MWNGMCSHVGSSCTLTNLISCLPNFSPKAYSHVIEPYRGISDPSTGVHYWVASVGCGSLRANQISPRSHAATTQS